MKRKHMAWIACAALLWGAQACGDDDDPVPPGPTTTNTGTGGSTSSGTATGTGGSVGGNTGTGGSVGGNTSTGGGGGDPGLATVSGTASRSGSATPSDDGIGTLCLSLRTTCSDAGTEVASASVASADLSSPNNTVDFSIPDVADGSLVLFGFLDDDESGCDDANTGDLIPGQCPGVDVTGGADVTGVTLVFQMQEQ